MGPEPNKNSLILNILKQRIWIYLVLVYLLGLIGLLIFSVSGIRVWENIYLIFYVILITLLTTELLIKILNSTDRSRHSDKTESQIEQTKTEFVSVVSHQLRTPLTAIKLFIEMLGNQEVGPLNALQKDYINDIDQSTERMIKLVNDLLNVSRLEAGKIKVEPENTEIEKFIQSIIKDISPIASAWNCRIIFEKPDQNFEPIPLDQTLMSQVIYNLISNAIKYSKRGGAKIIVNLQKVDHEIQISVKDFGIGIPEHERPKLFSKFSRADNAVTANPEGSGLGLYLAKLILNTVGGKIWFESIPNQGTTVFVRIPDTGMASIKGEKDLTISD